MREFRVQSSETDAAFIFSELRDEKFSVELCSSAVKCKREVWAYTDAPGIARLFEWLASQSKPWKNEKGWESIEGECKLYANCDALGKVTFDLELKDIHRAEEWQLQAQVKTEFGQLARLASQARIFFGSERG